MTSPLLSIVIPTFRRPGDLARLLQALEGQGAEDAEVVVVDNSPEGGAVVTPGTRLIHEPRPGVAHARNAGVAAARGRFVLFIDDDERPGPGWLAAWRAAAQGGIAAGFGPVEPVFEIPPPAALRPAFEAMFSRRIAAAPGEDVTARRAWLGTGNSMFDRARCFPEPEPFDPRFNGGGEDVWLLRRLAEERGLRFTWVAGARVSEEVPAARLTAAWLAARRFHAGRLRCIVEAGGGHRARVAFWMAAGLVQGLGYGLLSLAGPGRDAFRAKSAGGWGKVLWWRR